MEGTPRPTPEGFQADLMALRARVEAIRRVAEGALAELDSLAERVASQPAPAAPRPTGGSSRAPKEAWLTIKEAAAEFGLKPKWFHVHWREIPGAKPFGPKQIRIPRAGIEEYTRRFRETD
jgi:hypothetical protein